MQCELYRGCKDKSGYCKTYGLTAECPVFQYIVKQNKSYWTYTAIPSALTPTVALTHYYQCHKCGYYSYSVNHQYCPGCGAFMENGQGVQHEEKHDS